MKKGVVRDAVVAALSEISYGGAATVALPDGRSTRVIVRRNYDLPPPWLRRDNDIFPPAIVIDDRSHDEGRRPLVWAAPEIHNELFGMIADRWASLPPDEAWREWSGLVRLLDDLSMFSPSAGADRDFVSVAVADVMERVAAADDDGGEMRSAGARVTTMTAAMVETLQRWLALDTVLSWVHCDDVELVVDALLNCLDPDDWAWRRIGDRVIYVVATPGWRKQMALLEERPPDLQSDLDWAEVACRRDVFGWFVGGMSRWDYFCPDGVDASDRFVEDVTDAVVRTLLKVTT